MTSKTLGNVVPTEAEKARMFAVLNGLRTRYNERALRGGIGDFERFAEPSYNDKDDTAELRWSGGSRAWVSAWVYQIGESRTVLVWRHPSYRVEQDEQFIHDMARGG